MLESEKWLLRSLWWSGHQSLPALDEIRELLGRHGDQAARDDYREDQEQWQLRSKELSLGYAERTGEQHPAKCVYKNQQGIDDCRGGSSPCGHYSIGNFVSSEKRDCGRSSVCSANTAGPTAVYDLINCGPRQAFTVVGDDGQPLLVHNCWLYEPRPRYDKFGKKLPKIFPFITWPHQDPVILEIRQTLGNDDIGLEKSRGEGASWIAIWLSLQDWCFDEMVTIGYVSRSKEAVYNGKDPNSLFWKLDFGRNRLPDWMTGYEDKNRGWERNVNDNTFINNRLGNTIIGYAATGNVGSGGRTDWFLMDELSKFPRPQDAAAMDSTLSISDSRLIVGTPLGSTGAYFDIMHQPDSENFKKLRLHWSDNPSKNKGLYQLVKGVPVALDPVNNPLPKEYNPPSKKILVLFARLRAKGFDLEKGLRSPWYDKQCDRPGASPQSIAQELDIDYGGSSRQRFGSEFMKKLLKTVAPPLIRGNLTVTSDDLTPIFDLVADGNFLLWCNLDHALRPPKGNYGVSCDIGSGWGGSYTSNSTICVINLDTQEQVLEYAANNIQQSDFADLAIGVAKWFWDAKLGWEKNFATGFGEQVIERNYPNVLLRPVFGKRTKRQSTRQEVAWWTDPKTKPYMFEEIESAVLHGRITVRSQATKSECASYIVDEKRNIEFEGRSGDKTHGDRVIALGVGLFILKEYRQGTIRKAPSLPPENSMEHREREWDREESRKNDDWDHTTPADLIGRGSMSSGDRDEFGWQ